MRNLSVNDQGFKLKNYNYLTTVAPRDMVAVRS